MLVTALLHHFPRFIIDQLVLSVIILQCVVEHDLDLRLVGQLHIVSDTFDCNSVLDRV